MNRKEEEEEEDQQALTMMMIPLFLKKKRFIIPIQFLPAFMNLDTLEKNNEFPEKMEIDVPSGKAYMDVKELNEIGESRDVMVTINNNYVSLSGGGKSFKTDDDKLQILVPVSSFDQFFSFVEDGALINFEQMMLQKLFDYSATQQNINITNKEKVNLAVLSKTINMGEMFWDLPPKELSSGWFLMNAEEDINLGTVYNEFRKPYSQRVTAFKTISGDKAVSFDLFLDLLFPQMRLMKKGKFLEEKVRDEKSSVNDLLNASESNVIFLVGPVDYDIESGEIKFASLYGVEMEYLNEPESE